MKATVRRIYAEFDKRRKEYEALEADKEEWEELIRLEEKVKKNKK